MIPPGIATDLATEMAVDTAGAKGDIAGSGTIVRRWSDPRGVAERVFRPKYKSDLSHGKFLADGVIGTRCM